ncbi:MAG: hypothetical protein JKP98_21825 [Rhodobacteraceae bacterium]|nr:hypothetical protein [Paracoccaceae bacterium]
MGAAEKDRLCGIVDLVAFGILEQAERRFAQLGKADRAVLGLSATPSSRPSGQVKDGPRPDGPASVGSVVKPSASKASATAASSRGPLANSNALRRVASVISRRLSSIWASRARI